MINLRANDAKKVLPDLDAEVRENRYTYTLLNVTKSREALLLEREELLKQLAKLEELLT